MFSPEYFRQTSLLNGKEKLMGNLEVAGLIENMAFECIKNDIGLYAAQEQIKTRQRLMLRPRLQRLRVMQMQKLSRHRQKLMQMRRLTARLLTS